jgi:hypothetical protein
MRAKLTTKEAQATGQLAPFTSLTSALLKGLLFGAIAGLVLGLTFGLIPLPWSTTDASGLTFIFAQNSAAPDSDD